MEPWGWPLWAYMLLGLAFWPCVLTPFWMADRWAAHRRNRYQPKHARPDHD